MRTRRRHAESGILVPVMNGLSFRVRSLETVLVAASILCSASLAEAQFSQTELDALPRVCHAHPYINELLRRPKVSPDERAQWQSTLGESYQHYHHYCIGLLLIRRAASDTAQGRSLYLEAIENFDYVVVRSREDFALLPEVFLRKGMALRMIDEDAAAATEFLNAIRVKKDYTPAYAGLIDVHLALDDVASALAALETGLKYAPNSKILSGKREEIETRAKR